MFLVLALSVSLLITHCSKAWIQSKRGYDYTEDADGFWQKNIFEFGQYSYEAYVLLYNKRRHYRVDGHPELVSGSVRGEGQEKARGEMLKQVQHDNWSHLFFILPFWGSQFNTYVWFFVLLWLLANSFSLPCLLRFVARPLPAVGRFANSPHRGGD